jgi:hypothetical protein
VARRKDTRRGKMLWIWVSFVGVICAHCGIVGDGGLAAFLKAALKDPDISM